MKLKTWTGLVLSLSVLSLALFAQTQADETQYGVPELEAFHEVIYPIWHTAYPQKDAAALRGFVPEVDRLAKAVLEAKLPGILKERQDQWTKGLAGFKTAVQDYDRAASDKNDEALLAAAEALHSTYEMLNRIVRPLPPEVMEFHRSLYVVYHTYLPQKDYGRIRAACADLLAKAEVVAKAKLSKRFESKNDKFQTAAASLLESVRELAAVGPGNDAGLAPAVEKVHGQYQNLEKVFE